MVNKYKFLSAVAGVCALAIMVPRSGQAIQGCTLRDPDRDIRQLFPEATDFRTNMIAIAQRDPALHAVLQARLAEPLDPVYEDAGLPYSYYEVLQGQRVIGFVFGVNQKGRYGGMQLILATDPRGEIRAFYYQKLSNPHSRQLMASAFTDRFRGLRLRDFYFHQGYRRMGRAQPQDKIAKILSPVDSEAAREDVQATLRGVMKSLILFDLFWRDDRGRQVFEQVQEIVKQQKGKKQ